jgi:hypothetical protein
MWSVPNPAAVVSVVERIRSTAVIVESQVIVMFVAVP